MNTIDWKKEFSNTEAGIYLRPMTYEDTDTIVRWRNTDAVKKNFIYRGEFTKEGHEHWIKTRIETGEVIQFIVCDASTDMPLGSVYIRDIDRLHSKGEFGIFLGEASARGRGVGAATAKLMLDYCFRIEKLHRVYLRVLAENTPAIVSYEKAGFIKEGTLIQDVLLDGRYRDVVRMGVLNPENREDH